VLTEQVPFILVLEDLHWSDVSTLDLLSSLARRTEPARLLIIGTYRPEEGLAEGHPLRAITQELQGKRLCQELPLPLLDEVAVNEYLQRRFPTAMLPTRLPETLHRNTEGSPLFLTAVVNDLLDRGVITQIAGRWVLQGPVDAVAAEVPVSIRQLLTRQIDRLHDKERQILQAASVAGFEFSAAAVAAAAGIDTVAVEACCEILVRRQQFLRRVGVSEWPDGTQTGRYGFLHALYQQLWHERVPQHRCQRLHLKIGERLEQAYGSRVGELATELAVHFDQGRDTQRAIHYYQHAAGIATQRHAYQEAIAHLTAALTLLKSLPETATRHQRELQLQFSLHWMLGRSKGEAAPELDIVVARERELLQWSEETPQLFGPVFGLFDFYLVRGELASVRFFADYALRLARRFPEEPLLGAASMMMGICEFLEGELLSARTSLEPGMAAYTQSRTEASLFWETGLGCFLYAGLTLWHLGFPDQALHCASETITRARVCGARFVQAWGLNYLAWVQILRGDVAAVRTHATAALQLAEAQGFASMREAGRIYQGWALSMQEGEHGGTLQIQQGIAALHSTSGITFRTFYLALLAEAYGRTGQTEEGLSVLAEALTLVDKTGERFYEAELYRLKGALILQSQTSQERPRARLRQVKASQDRSEDTDSRSLTPDPQAEAYFLKAIEIARRQQSKSLELRAVMSLVRLRQRRVSERATCTTQHVRHTRPAEEHKVLLETYNWFTEGFETVDLQEAKALLAELS
jgi:tetratricopeptide (TPR) repeat protein